jgi:hypothetical protein
VGGNPTNQTYTSAAPDSKPTNALDDGKGFFSNLWNILFGKATPHNCYGTSGKVEDCDKQWGNLPKNNSPTITKPDYKAPVIAPQYQSLDTVSPQVQQSSNEQMNQLLESQPLTAAPMTPTQQANDQLETLKNFKQEQ